MFVCPECAQTFSTPGTCNVHGAPLSSSADDPLLGQAVGSYRIARLIGKGGMGEVYLGVHPGIQSRVAIKVLSYSASENRNLVERFFAEARAVNVIRHEGIVNVLDLSVLPDGRPYIVMEYLDGAPLSRHLGGGPLPLGTGVGLLIETLDALAAAHAVGITHRDLKPDNIYVTGRGRAKILDFGIAKLRPELGQMGAGTSTGALLGTPHYMSPEQALGRSVDYRTDIYSMAVIAFELATGRRPFDAGSLFELLRLQIEAVPPSPRSLRFDVPLALEATILRGLDKDPARRFASATEFARALDEVARMLPREAFPALISPTLGSSGGSTLRAAGLSGPPPPVPTPYAHTSPFSSSASGPVPATRAEFSASVASDSKSSIAPWIVLGSVALLFLALIGGGGIGVAYYLGRASTPGSQTTNAPEEPARATKPFVFQPSHLDVDSFLGEAQARARKHYPDARLAMMTLTQVRYDGTIDLENGKGVISSIYISPKAADAVPANSGTKLGACAVAVSVTGSGVFDSSMPMYNCSTAIPGTPRCSLRQVMQKATSGDTSAVANAVTFMSFGSTGKIWVVNFGNDKPSHMVPDEC